MAARLLNFDYVIHPVLDATVRYVFSIKYDVALGQTANADFRLLVAASIVDRWYDSFSLSVLNGTPVAALNVGVERTVKLDGFVPAGEVVRLNVVAPQGATISWLVNQETLHEQIPDRFDPTGLFK